MKLSQAQLAILRAHERGELPFIAKQSLSTRVLLLHGLLSFKPGRKVTRLSSRGRRRLELLASPPIQPAASPLSPAREEQS